MLTQIVTTCITNPVARLFAAMNNASSGENEEAFWALLANLKAEITTRCQLTDAAGPMPTAAERKSSKPVNGIMAFFHLRSTDDARPELIRVCDVIRTFLATQNITATFASELLAQPKPDQKVLVVVGAKTFSRIEVTQRGYSELIVVFHQ